MSATVDYHLKASDPQNQRSFNLRRYEVTDSKEEVRLIWLGDNVDDIARFSRIRSLLEQLDPFALFYTDLDRCTL